MEANPDFLSLSTLELEHSITQVCANINAATYQQLTLIAEFDRRQGWGDDGVRSCAHWLNFRCGVSLTAAREKLRVAHALNQLPKTKEAFASGSLSYSKARAITRVGTPNNEDTLLSYARYGTASQLDKTVRLYRQQYNSEGELTVEEQWQTEAEQALKRQNERQLDVYWDENQCFCLKAKLTPEQGAVILKAIEAAVESIKQDEPTEEPNNQNTPAGMSESHPNQRRKADALMLMAEAYLKDTKVAANTDDRYQVVVHVDSEVLAKQQFTHPSSEPDCYIENQVALPVDTTRRLSCSCKLVTALTKGGEPLSIGRSSRAIPTGIRRALAIRDGVCQFPGCDCTKHLDAHHIVHWANGGETSLDNLMEVCHHHHTLLHEGGYSVHRDKDGVLNFQRPDGSAIVSHQLPFAEDLTQCQDPPWSWCGDNMDYSSALYVLSKTDQAPAPSIYNGLDTTL